MQNEWVLFRNHIDGLTEPVTPEFELFAWRAWLARSEVVETVDFPVKSE